MAKVRVCVCLITVAGPVQPSDEARKADAPVAAGADANIRCSSKSCRLVCVYMYGLEL